MGTKVLSVVFALIVGAAHTANGQSNRYDHVHLAARDAPKAAQWYVAHLGGKPYDRPDRIIFGEITFSFLEGTPKPSKGSVVDHLGFSFPDIDAKVKELESAGAKVVTPVRDAAGLFKIAFVEDPWGTTLEIVQDSELLGFHHIHLRVADPEASLKWFHETFGGERTKLRGRLDAVKYSNPDVWLLALRGEGMEPSAGHSIDHISWRFTDLDTAFQAMKAKGVKILSEPRDVPRKTELLRAAMIEDATGVKVELTRRTPPIP